ncbi:MAG: leucine-rich repeat protein [Exiguobacterium sp.]|nr:leucine-rich repeat protein [Exiguobacterium sp.]
MIFNDFVEPNLPEIYQTTQGDAGDVNGTYIYNVFIQGINEFPIVKSSWADGTRLTARAVVQTGALEYEVGELYFVLNGGSWNNVGGELISEYEYDPDPIVPEGTIDIVTNGEWNVYSYASANVSVTGGGDIGKLIDGTISSYEDATTSFIRPYAFAQCSSLKTVSFTASSVSGGAHAFESCTSLTKANIPNLTHVNGNMFNGCTNLTSPSFPNATVVDMSAFASCGFVSIVLTGATMIKLGAFSDCHALKEISLPAYTESKIADYAFYNCYQLSSVNIPNAKQIGTYTFGYCSKLSAFSFGSISYVGSNAFQEAGLTGIISMPSVTTILSSAFQSCISMMSMDAPVLAGVPSYAFKDCGWLHFASMPEATYLYQNAFAGCYSLQSAYFPKVTFVQASAFYDCRSLSVVSLPKLETMYSSAFQNCHRLMSVYFLNSVATTFYGSSTIFASTPIGGYTAQTGGQYGSIYVPSSLYATYRTRLNAVSDRIVSMTDEEIQALG